MLASHLKTAAVALALLSAIPFTTAQTTTSCNPLEGSNCPADPALGRSVDVDFTSESDQFTTAGTVNYGSDGAEFTISGHGDSPTITSKWYIMFGKVTFTLKAAPGQGVVSSAVLQSDDLDEIDWEFVGNQETSAQSNYFGKGITSSYDRGGNHVLSGSTTTSEFHTYTVEWTSEQIVWQLDGTTVRVLTPADAETNQYPQTPMLVKLGVWAGGDPSNAPGTISWAGGAIDYSSGPFTMYVKEVSVTDYSTGSEYHYDGTAGTWESIGSTGGTINGNADGSAGSSTASATATYATTTSNPEPFDTCSGWKACESSSASHTGWPWVGSPTDSSSSTATASLISYSSASSTLFTAPSSSSQPSSQYCLASSRETITSYDQQGFPTTVVINPSAPKTYDSRGFLISAAAECSGTSSTLVDGADTTITSTAAASSQSSGTSSEDSGSAQADTMTTGSSTPLVYATTNTAFVQSPSGSPTTASDNIAAVPSALGGGGIIAGVIGGVLGGLMIF